jgi:hypothetical protein
VGASHRLVEPYRASLAPATPGVARRDRSDARCVAEAGSPIDERAAQTNHEGETEESSCGAHNPGAALAVPRNAASPSARGAVGGPSTTLGRSMRARSPRWRQESRSRTASARPASPRWLRVFRIRSVGSRRRRRCTRQNAPPGPPAMARRSRAWYGAARRRRPDYSTGPRPGAPAPRAPRTARRLLLGALRAVPSGCVAATSRGAPPAAPRSAAALALTLAWRGRGRFGRQPRASLSGSGTAKWNPGVLPRSRRGRS